MSVISSHHPRMIHSESPCLQDLTEDTWPRTRTFSESLGARAWGCTNCTSTLSRRRIMDILLVLTFGETVDMAVLHTWPYYRLQRYVYFFVALHVLRSPRPSRALPSRARLHVLSGAQRKMYTFTEMLSFICGNAAALDAVDSVGSKWTVDTLDLMSPAF